MTFKGPSNPNYSMFPRFYDPRQCGLKGTDLPFALCIFWPRFSPKRMALPVSVCALPYDSSKNSCSHSPAHTK